MLRTIHARLPTVREGGTNTEREGQNKCWGTEVGLEVRYQCEHLVFQVGR